MHVIMCSSVTLVLDARDKGVDVRSGRAGRVGGVRSRGDGRGQPGRSATSSRARAPGAASRRGGPARLASFGAHLFFDPLHVPAAEPPHFAAELEVPPDLGVAQDAEAVDHGQWPARPRGDVIG